MSTLDWAVLVATLAGVVGYGLFKSKTARNLEGYFLSSRSMPWYLVLLGIVGTQASAITFLSAPGQAFTDGMRFVQYYFGLPLAMIVISLGFLPLFSRLKVFTAYEFLEQRFGLPTRLLTSGLFLLSRGLSTGISICAPAIILSSLLGWNLYLTSALMGGLLIVYTVSGGARAVAYTQQLQLLIIFAGMGYAGWHMVHALPPGLGLVEAMGIGSSAGKMNIITTGVSETGFGFKDRYNLFSGLIGGFFLALSYFGTDQSQVGRYLTAKNETESRTGLLMNGLVKVPMQFLILLLGVLLLSFYHFAPQPVFFNKAEVEKIAEPGVRAALGQLEAKFSSLQKERTNAVNQWVQAKDDSEKQVARQRLQTHQQAADAVRKQYQETMKAAGADANDTNYIFLRFVYDHFPAGLMGLLIAIIFLAAWGSIAAALNALAGATMVDFYCRLKNEPIAATCDDPAVQQRQYGLGKWITFGWGIFCISVAMMSNRLGSLIEAVNILGSLFYGVILGIFLVAFYLKKVGGKAVFMAAILGEAIVILLFYLNEKGTIGLSFLWLNAVGALVVILLAICAQGFLPKPATSGP